MRRISLLLGAAVILLAAFVGTTLKRGLDARRKARAVPAPVVRPGDDLSASSWTWNKDDPETNKPISRMLAKSIRATHDPSTFELVDMRLRLFDKGAITYTYVKSNVALFDERSGVLKSAGPVQIVMHVPAAQDADRQEIVAKHVRVDTTGVTYETKTGKATTDKLATFTFPDGGGEAVGADYDPNTKALHLHSQVSLDWIGKGTAADKLHVDTTDLVYKEAEGKVYMMPDAKLTRRNTVIDATNVVVQLQDGRLHQIDGDHAAGTDARDDRRTGYSADKMTALFNENGTLINIVGNGNAKVTSSQPDSTTTLTGNRADLRFSAVITKPAAGESESDGEEESILHLVMADGNAVAESAPVVKPQEKAALLADTRILRSEHIELEMQTGGKDLKEIRTSGQAQLEFKPNRLGVPHRVVDASRLRVFYGAGSYVDTFQAWNAQTRTDKVAVVASEKPVKPPQPALTWSDRLIAKFIPQTNQVASIQQTGNFRYQEGARKASAAEAFLDQTRNRMTLSEAAHISDDAGSTVADRILMEQSSGDMEAQGHVVSTRDPDKSQKPGTSMLDDTEPMQAKAERMITRDKNKRVHYEGKAIVWQGANRILSDSLDIDRDEQTLHAKGNVVSELLDKKSKPDANRAEEKKALTNSGGNKEDLGEGQPVFTSVYAPELVYRDDERIAHYTGGVKMIRQKMTVTARELTAYLTPKQEGSDDSSLDHAVAEGGVTVFRVIADNRTRTGTGERCEYFTKDERVVLTGGSPRMRDSYKGVTEGERLTYFSEDDHLVVDGGKKPVYTEMKKK